LTTESAALFRCVYKREFRKFVADEVCADSTVGWPESFKRVTKGDYMSNRQLRRTWMLIN